MQILINFVDFYDNNMRKMFISFTVLGVRLGVIL